MSSILDIPFRPKAVFIDRDGVLVRSNVVGGKPIAVRSMRDFKLLPGVIQAFSQLKAAKLKTAIVTNQPDLAKGLITPDTMAAMTERLNQRLAPDLILVCPHAQTAACDCRKPKPGLLLQGADRLGIELSRAVMIGDRASDMAAGRSAGCECVFIDRHYGESGPDAGTYRASAAHFPAAVRLILERLDRS
jgi:D-glycero-D-manno-heptose 1,7-bisphosphate phosphatase